MMKLTVAFLASLAAVDAAQAHGRRHVRRAGVDYGNGYGYGAPSYQLPGTGSDASSTAALPESSKVPEGAEASPSLPYLGTGTAPIPTDTPAAEFPPTFDTVVPEVPLTTAPAFPTAYPTGGSPAAISSSALVLSPSKNCTTTAAPHSSSPADKETIVTETPVSEITHTITETLTYTVGRGENAHQTTTEIVSVSTETIYKTVTITKEKAHPAPTPSAGKEEEITGTTTVKTTSTTVKYITVYPTPSVPSSGEEGASPSKGAEQGEGASCAPPVTVTITAQETVTVTVGKNSPSQETSSPDEGEVTSTTHITTTLYVTASPVEQPSQAPAYPTGPAAPFYPIPGNGTHPSPPAGGAAGPSGFLTSKKPAPTMPGYGTGEVPVPTPSATTSAGVPADSLLPSLPIVGAETPAPSEAAKPSEAPAVSSGGYGYGYKKRWGF